MGRPRDLPASVASHIRLRLQRPVSYSSMIHSAWPNVKPKLSAIYRRCRCYTCIAHPDSAALLRRPAAGSRVTHGMVLKSAISISVICAAAAADADVKQKRRAKLDNDIKAVEQELAAGQEKQARQLADLTERARARHKEQTRHVDTNTEQDSRWDLLLRMTSDSPSTVSSVLAHAPDVLNQLDDRTVPDQHGSARCKHSLYGNPHIRKSLPVWSPKKLVTFEYSIAKLATRMMIHVDNQPEDDDSAPGKVLRQRLSDLNRQLDILTREDPLELQDTPRLSFPQYSPNTANARELLTNIQSAMNNNFERYDCGELSIQDVATRMGYNLLISPVPPTLSILTNLVKRFSRLKEYALAEMVVDSVSESHLRPDELYTHEVLVHYLRKNDATGFSRFAILVEGSGNGLMLKKSQQEKVIARAPHNARVWRGLVGGFLRIGNPRKAMELHDRMLHAGYGADVNILTEIMKYYALEACNIDKAFKVWSNIIANHMPSSTRVRVLTGSPEHHSFRAALLICKQSGLSQTFAKIYRRALQHGLPMSALLPRNLAEVHLRRSSYMIALARSVGVAEEKAELLQGDLIKWALHVLAIKLKMAGTDRRTIRTIFHSLGSTDDLFDQLQVRSRNLPKVKMPHFGDRMAIAHRVSGSVDLSSPDHTPSPQRNAKSTNRQLAGSYASSTLQKGQSFLELDMQEEWAGSSSALA